MILKICTHPHILFEHFSFLLFTHGPVGDVLIFPDSHGFDDFCVWSTNFVLMPQIFHYPTYLDLHCLKSQLSVILFQQDCRVYRKTWVVQSLPYSAESGCPGLTKSSDCFSSTYSCPCFCSTFTVSDIFSFRCLSSSAV